MKWELKCVIEPEGDWYVSYCEELGIASQGETTNEAKRNMEEAIEMFFEDASPSETISLLARLEPESSVAFLHPPKISVMQHEGEQGTQWVLVAV